MIVCLSGIVELRHEIVPVLPCAELQLTASVHWLVLDNAPLNEWPDFHQAVDRVHYFRIVAIAHIVNHPVTHELFAFVHEL